MTSRRTSIPRPGWLLGAGFVGLLCCFSLYFVLRGPGDDVENARSSDARSDRWSDESVEVSVLPAIAEPRRLVVTNERVHNAEASIPPQCYTRTEGQHNPCYTCHQVYDRKQRDRLNPLTDGHLQGSYDFSDVGLTNHWRNLFVDRSEWIARVDDEAIVEYVETENYSSLGDRLRAQEFQGFIPDLEGYERAGAAFDEQGLARDGSAWVAFNYKPFPGTFWPTNGSTDDVLIRLAPTFRSLDGKFDRDTYYVNLTLVELNVKGLKSAALWEIDENKWGVDLDGDGEMGRTTHVRARTHYVGDAAAEEVVFEQFPVGSEFMHSVRYVGLDDDDRVVVPPRMKELRYMKKVAVLPRQVIKSKYDRERREKRLGQLPNYLNLGDQGIDNSLGWYVKGFIEDYDGHLRPQTVEEDMYCMGCHKGIGTTIDSTFSFGRKVTGAEGWGYIDLVGMPDAPSIGEDGGEILNYLRRVGGGSEFRQNPEMRERWFDAEGNVDEDAVRAADVATLISPSRRRALDLNKAYTHIVRHQSYVRGRDATVTPPQNVFEAIEEEAVPLQPEHRHYGWDLRLDWAKAPAPSHI